MKLDHRSLKFKIWMYFALFAALLMLILWFLQIFFLRTYYEEMKISETRKVANTIIDKYHDPDILTAISNISNKNDMYIHVETSDGTIIFSPNSEKRRMSALYIREMNAVRKELLQDGRKTVSTIIYEPGFDNNTLAYGAVLDLTPGHEVILYIFSPLYPVESTVEILANQLIIVTIISLLLAFVLSFFISKRLTKPIINITNSASKLAKGQYDVTFDGADYTEINQLADTLNYTSKELVKTENLKRDLIANVSHDLRTPLTMVKSYAEMIRDISGDDPERRNSHLKVIISEADRLNQLVTDLLVLSKIQSGVESLHITKFNIQKVFSDIIHSYRVFYEQEGFLFVFHCDSEYIISGDETRIKQVITNLLNNAIRYGGEDKTITITIKESTDSNDRIRIEVSDHGIGIPADELEHIWEKYYKASSNHIRTSSGTGLGLSIVKEILLLHNAKFGVESKEGTGSTFWFELLR